MSMHDSRIRTRDSTQVRFVCCSYALPAIIFVTDESNGRLDLIKQFWQVRPPSPWRSGNGSFNRTAIRMAEDQDKLHMLYDDGIFQRGQFVGIQDRPRYANNKDIAQTLIEN